MLSMAAVIFIFALMLIYLAAIVFAFKGDSANTCRWIKNNPTVSIFFLIILPFAAASMIEAIIEIDFSKVSDYELIGIYSFFIIQIVFGFANVIQDSLRKERILPPYEFSAASDALQMEIELRLKVQSKRLDSISAQINYTSEFPNLLRLHKIFGGGGFLAYWTIFLNIVTSIVVSSVIWYISIMGYFSFGNVNEISNDRFELVIFSFTILMLWFPIRLYSEWYSGFYSLSHMKSFQIYWMLAAIWIVVLILILIVTIPPISLVVFGAIISFFSLVTAVLGLRKPKIFRYVAEMIERSSTLGFCSFGVIIFTVFVVLAKRIFATA